MSGHTVSRVVHVVVLSEKFEGDFSGPGYEHYFQHRG